MNAWCSAFEHNMYANYLGQHSCQSVLTLFVTWQTKRQRVDGNPIQISRGKVIQKMPRCNSKYKGFIWTCWSCRKHFAMFSASLCINGFLHSSEELIMLNMYKVSPQVEPSMLNSADVWSLIGSPHNGFEWISCSRYRSTQVLSGYLGSAVDSVCFWLILL